LSLFVKVPENPQMFFVYCSHYWPWPAVALLCIWV